MNDRLIKQPLTACGLVLLSLALASPLPAQANPPGTPPVTPPVTQPGTVVDTYHGVAVPDPYRHLQQLKDPAVAAWMRAHSDHAHATLRALPERAAILADLQRFSRATAAQVHEPVRLPQGAWVTLERRPDTPQARVVLRDTLASEGRVIFDPASMKSPKGELPAVTFHRVSPDARRLAVGVAFAGSEATTMHVLDIATGRALVRPVTRTDWAMPFWVDANTLTFNRMQALKPGMPATARDFNSAAWALDVRTGRHTLLLARRHAGGAAVSPIMAPTVTTHPQGKHALATLYDGVNNDVAYYVAPRAAALAGRARWTLVAKLADQVQAARLHGDTLYLITTLDAPRHKLMAVDLRAPQKPWRTVVPPSDRVVTGMAPARDALYVEVREGNVKKLLRVAHAPGSTREVALPQAGSFKLLGAESGPDAYDPEVDGVLLGLSDWTHPRQIFQVHADGRVTNTGLQPQAAVDGALGGQAPDDLQATEVLVPRPDGAQVPMSIVAKKGVVLDGRNPLLLTGYASYGHTIEPRFSPARRAWLDRGGVLAFANPRGSGVYGRAWHEGGKGPTKPNTWRDFIACAEWLVAARWTSPPHLAIQGGSAGGILVGMAMTERADLFAAVVPAVGALDTLLSETTANGPSNIPEFGSVTTQAGFKALLAMSAYHHVRPGTAYPAVLLEHGVNDPRVDVWNSTKMAARLMAATTSGKPVLLRLDYEGGHGMGDSQDQEQARTADTYAFLFQQLGGTRPPTAPKAPTITPAGAAK